MSARHQHRGIEVAFVLSAILIPCIFCSAGNSVAAELGTPAPAISITEWHFDNHIDLSKVIGKAVVVLDFARTWYPPYRFQLLAEAAVQKETGRSNICFLLISNEPGWAVREIKDQLPNDFVWYAAADPDNALLRSFGIEPGPSCLPLTVILDRQGRVVWCAEAPDNLEEMLTGIVAGTWDIARSRKMMDDFHSVDSLGSKVKETPDNGCDRIISLAGRLANLELPQHKDRVRRWYLSLATERLLNSSACSDRYLGDAMRFGRISYGDGQSGSYRGHKLMADLMAAADSVEQAIEYQMKAIRVVSDDSVRTALKAELNEYRNRLAEKTHQKIVPDSSDTPEAAAVGSSGAEPPLTITSQEAVEDLEQAVTSLRNSYAGYDDADWKLHLAGSGWTARLGEHRARLLQKDTYTPEEFLSFLKSFLEPIIDEHFFLKLPVKGTGKYKLVKFSKRFKPFFTDVRVRRDGTRFVVVERPGTPPDIVGGELVDVTVADPRDAQLNRPYLYRTIPAQPDAEEYLIGTFMEHDSAKSITLVFRSSDREQIRLDLPLHRGRVRDPEAGSGDAWRFLSGEDIPIPVLRVRTAVETSITDGFWEIMPRLRRENNVILDLRANLGGSDAVAMNWCGAMCPGKYRMSGGNSIVAGGPGNPRSRWNPLTIEDGIELKGQEGRTKADSCFGGRLYVILDENVASSGETFAGLARQIPGAIWVGENSRGCVSYGIADITRTLKHSRIIVRFGYVRFSWHETFPIREGVGFFPDYWLDSDDPYQDIARLAALTE